MIKKNFRIFKIIFAVLAFSLVFYAGYGYGSRYGSTNRPPSYIKNANQGMPSDIDFSLFWQAWNKAKDLYNGDAKTEDMLYGAISGMVSSFGDPYSVFLKPSDNEALSSDLSGKFEGIGAELTMKDNQVVVIAPLSGSPAEKSGIRAKDIFIEVDGTSTSSLNLNEVVSKIRGKAGSVVKIKLIHSGGTEPIEISVTRENIKIDSVTYAESVISGKKIATIKVSQFGDDTMGLAKQYALKAKNNNVEGIIIDLRNNPGGYLDSSVQFSNMFLEKGKVVVSEVNKSGTKSEYKTDEDPILANLPLVILVNGGSASAAEIVTGAMKDNGRAVTIGEKTFGKGSVQQLEPLSGGAALKITIAKWLTPNGTEINKVGIIPDIVVPLTDADQTANLDPQMDKAKTEIISKIK